MAASFDISVESIRQLDSNQKRQALYLLAREILRDDSQQPVCLSNPQDDAVFFLSQVALQLPPSEVCDPLSFPPESRRRAKAAVDQSVPIDEFLKTWPATSPS